MSVEEAGQVRNHPLPGQPAGHVHPQPSLELAGVATEHALQVLHVVQQVARALLELCAVRAEPHAAGGPVQQLYAELGLQPLHGQRHAGLGQAELFGRGSERAQFGDPQEAAQLIEAIHGLFVSVGQSNQDRVIYACWQYQ